LVKLSPESSQTIQEIKRRARAEPAEIRRADGETAPVAPIRRQTYQWSQSGLAIRLVYRFWRARSSGESARQ
jgi:hypothetical protein